MAAKTTAMSLLLLVSLLSLFTATTVATFINPLIIPSCSGQGKLAKCYQDYKAAYGAAHASSGKNGTADTTIVLARNAVYAAKTSCSITIQFFKSFRGGSQRFITCEHTFNIAIIHLRKASFILQKTNLSKIQVYQVQKSVQIAAQHVLKCTVNSNFSTRNQTSESVTLCDIAFTFCKMIGH